MSVNLDSSNTPATWAMVLHLLFVNLGKDVLTFILHHMVATDVAPVWITLLHVCSSTFRHTIFITTGSAEFALIS